MEDAFYSDILVDIPKKKRIMTQCNRIYVLEIFARKGKKVPRDDIHIVGSLDHREDTKMHPNSYYYQRHPEAAKPDEKEELPEMGEFSRCQNVGDYLLIRKICDELNITNLVSEIFDGSSMVIAYLIYLLYMRDSSAQNYQSFAYHNYCGLNYIPSEKDWSEFFNDTLSKERVCEFFSRWFTSKMQSRQKIRVAIDFDSTNINTSSRSVSLAERGHPKVDEELPQVNWITLADRETGMILFVDIYFGSIVDMDHCKTVIEKTKASYNQAIADRKGKKLTEKMDFTKNLDIKLCLDRGYYFAEVIQYLCDSGGFVVMGKKGYFFTEIISKNPPSAIRVPENRVDNSLYGVKIGNVQPFKDRKFSKKLNAYLFYNSRHNDAIIDSKMNYLENLRESLIGKKDRNGSILRTYKDKFDFVYSKRKSIIREATIRKEYLKELYEETGYFFLLSDEDMTVREAYEFYHQRDCIEKDFRDEKTGCDLEKTYARNDTAFQGKVLLASLVSIIRSDIRHRMKPFFKQYSGETTETVIREVGKVQVQKIGTVYKPMTNMTSKIKQIMSFYDMNNKDLYRLCQQLGYLEVES